jgi:hypothetical protein
LLLRDDAGFAGGKCDAALAVESPFDRDCVGDFTAGIPSSVAFRGDICATERRETGGSEADGCRMSR